MQEEPIEVALEIVNQVEQLPEQYRVDAFRVLLEYKLGSKAVAVAQKAAPEFPAAAEQISFSEFLNQLEELKNNPQRFAAVAYYYEKYRKENSVTQEDIVSVMREAGLLSPANFIRDIAIATSTKKALLMQVDPKDGTSAWQLTRTGRTFIEQRIEQ